MSTHPLSQPWAISEDGMSLVLAIWSRGDLYGDVLARAKAEQEAGQRPAANDRRYEVVRGTALIPVVGPLFRHANMMTDVSGASSYARIRKDLRAALDDQEVSAIVLTIDSPGGEVAGCGELAQEIREGTARKAITAYVEGACASAAYWLASAAGLIVVAPTAMLGSIGVRVACVDDSGRQEKDGVRRVEIVSSQSPGKRGEPLNDEVLARVQRRADELADIFIGDVARFRGVKPAKVAADFGAGDVVIGQRAVSAGMADAVGVLATLLPDVNSAGVQPALNLNGVAQMNTNTSAHAAAAMDPEEKPEGEEEEEEEEKEKEEHQEPDGDECEEEDEEKAAMRATIAALSAQVAHLSQQAKTAAPVETAEAWVDKQIKAGYPASERASLLRLRSRKPAAAEQAAATVLKAVGSLKRSQRLTAGGAPVGVPERTAASTARAAGQVSMTEQQKISAYARSLIGMPGSGE